MTDHYGRTFKVFEMALLGLYIFLAITTETTLAIEVAAQTPQKYKSLLRKHDPIVVNGTMLEVLQGIPISSLRLFACHQGNLKVIPFQIDERDPEGVLVLPSGPMAQADGDQERFDYNDEMVFMAADTGDRVTKALFPEEVDQWVEIMVTDPVRPSEKAWVYLCSFVGATPPLSDIDYVHYLPEQEQVRTDYYQVNYRPGYALYSDLFYPQDDGGFGPDLMDRIKIRITVKFLFNAIKIRKNEDDFRAKVVSWKDGPVRVLRNVETYVRVMFRLSSPSIYSVNEYYPYHMYSPLRFNIPFNLKWVFNKFGISDWQWKIYGDFPGLKGGFWYSNRNPEGVLISEDLTSEYIQEHIDCRYLVWGYATKENVGSMFINLVIPDAIYQYAQLYLNLEENQEYPPEDIPGEYSAGAMVSFRDVNSFLFPFLSKGTYELGIETFFPPPGFKPEGVEQWRQMRLFPLLVDNTASYPGQNLDNNKLGDTAAYFRSQNMNRYESVTRLTDVRGKEVILYDTKFHVGSVQTTPRRYILGEDVETKQWYRKDFDSIRTIEACIKPIDPLTGMANPMFHCITQKDGTVKELMTCKPCRFSGYLPDGRKISYSVSQVKRLDFIKPDEVAILNGQMKQSTIKTEISKKPQSLKGGEANKIVPIQKRIGK